MAKKPKRIFTEGDLAAAKKLKSLWENKPEELTQEKIGQAWSADGITQGAVSQYLRGAVPCRAVATLRFTRIFKVKPTDIRDDFPELTGELDPEAYDVAQQYMALSPAQKRKFRAALELVSDAPTASDPGKKRRRVADEARPA